MVSYSGHVASLKKHEWTKSNLRHSVKQPLRRLVFKRKGLSYKNTIAILLSYFAAFQTTTANNESEVHIL